MKCTAKSIALKAALVLAAALSVSAPAFADELDRRVDNRIYQQEGREIHLAREVARERAFEHRREGEGRFLHERFGRAGFVGRRDRWGCRF